MKQYINIYLMIDKKYETRMFIKNLGELDPMNTLNYEQEFKRILERYNNYLESNKQSQKHIEDYFILIEKEIPKNATVYNYVRKSIIQVEHDN